MQNLETLTSYTSAFEEMQGLPGGLPLHKRHSLPEYLSVDEISSLLYETEEGQNNVKQLLRTAILQGELNVSYVFVGTAPSDPEVVVRSLHSHIKLLEKELREFKSEIIHLIKKNVMELETDILKTKDAIEIEVTKILPTSADSQIESPSLLNLGKWSQVSLTQKSKLPMKGKRGIGYETETTSVIFQLISSGDMKLWLIAKNEWPLHETTPINRWFIKKTKANNKPLVNTTRESIIKLVADDLKSQGIDPLSFPGKVAEVFTLS